MQFFCLRNVGFWIGVSQSFADTRLAGYLQQSLGFDVFVEHADLKKSSNARPYHYFRRGTNFHVAGILASLILNSVNPSIGLRYLIEDLPP